MVALNHLLAASLLGFAAAYPNPGSDSQPSPSTLSTAVSSTTSSAAPDQTSLFQDLFTAPTALKRFQRLLSKDKMGDELLTGDALKTMIVFDFNNATAAVDAKGNKAKGGATKAANIESFPILTTLGISTTLGFLNPCGINTPHVHPRATEFLTVVNGTVDFGYFLENAVFKSGSQEVAGTLTQFQGTVFPQGSIHYQFNPTCENAVFVATLNSEDPGTSQVAQGFFGLNGGVVNATLGAPKQIDGKNLEEFRGLIPLNLAQDVEVCLKRCEGHA